MIHHKQSYKPKTSTHASVSLCACFDLKATSTEEEIFHLVAC